MTIIDSRQIVSLHTHSGVQVHQYGPEDQTGLKWNRQLRDVSSCDLGIPSRIGYSELPDITPWLHWVSVWDSHAENLYWSGPIQKVTANRDGISISARDVAALAGRTRNPTTKRWDAVDPSTVAEELWAAMAEVHNLRVRPIVRPDPEGDRYSFATTADTQMMDATMADLVNLGLKWTVVGGVPILGPAPLTPLASLGEDDFLGGGMEIVRDGSASYNDILLRGGDNLARTHREMGGLNLQTIVTINDMFGVSNVDRAIKQYAKYTSRIRDALSLGDSSTLHPDGPVDIDHLIPSTRFTVTGYGLQVLMELETVEVTCSNGNAAVSVKMESVDVPGGRETTPELLGKVTQR